jgi:hypothetical protein
MKKLLLVLAGTLVLCAASPALAQEATPGSAPNSGAAVKPADGSGEPGADTPPPTPEGTQLGVAEIAYVGGNGDANPDPGERLQVFVSLNDYGTKAATDVRATLTIAETYVHVLENTATWPDIAPGETAKSTQPFVIQIDPGAPRSGGCSFGGGGGTVDSGTPVTIAPAEGDGSTGSASGGEGTVASDGTTASDSTAPSNDTTASDGTTPSDDTATSAPADSSSASSSASFSDEGKPADSERYAQPSEPAPDETSPVGFEGKMAITASGKQFDEGLTTHVMCAMEMGAPAPNARGGGLNPGAPSTSGAQDAKTTDLASSVGVGSRQSGGRAPAAGVAAALLAAAAAFLIRSALQRGPA